MVVNYDHKTFIAKATGLQLIQKLRIIPLQSKPCPPPSCIHQQKKIQIEIQLEKLFKISFHFQKVLS
jgi:hypothetical protein